MFLPEFWLEEAMLLEGREQGMGTEGRVQKGMCRRRGQGGGLGRG